MLVPAYVWMLNNVMMLLMRVTRRRVKHLYHRNLRPLNISDIFSSHNEKNKKNNSAPKMIRARNVCNL
jgi:hypothetical protein